ncbi:hypothetical protein KUTeg_015821 [Tegillarca granosa]|uniref:EF-hand domain-containing protein n=1 Tax=Tegillarca granosa TaxID=220873 RepID=A0ABQ9EN12_TEGGR|nr:hypothetical protein KUTeg_015821 [Tegillarca granosa]
MGIICHPFVVLAVFLTVTHAVKESSEHGHQKHFEHGEHNPHHDHEAILGSSKEEEEFEELPPEEAKKRLGILAVRMDVNQDGVVNMEELTDWIVNSFRKLDEEDISREMEDQDKDGDGLISWEEYMISQAYDTVHDDEEEQESYKTMKEEDELRFKAADLNKDGKLDKEEFMAFSHPYNYDHMYESEMRIKLNAVDKDKDGKVSIEEFLSDVGGDEGERYKFEDYDKNKDGNLDSEEMKPWLMADNNHEAAVEEAKHLFSLLGKVKPEDLHMSIQEIMDHHEEFVGSSATDYGNVLHSVKDEL